MSKKITIYFHFLIFRIYVNLSTYGRWGSRIYEERPDFFANLFEDLRFEEVPVQVFMEHSVHLISPA